MAEKAREIIGIDPDELIKMLNEALADEWLAVYQYWAGSKVVKGPMRPQVEEELIEHHKEELEHADMLAERIIQLGGTPILEFAELEKVSGCGYDAPSDFHVKKILSQNISGEQCAIEAYKKILDRLKSGDDQITFNMIRKIMQDEVEHEEELSALLEDIEMI